MIREWLDSNISSPILRFLLWTSGTLGIVAMFSLSSTVGNLDGFASFFIGWFICGIYSVVMFCGIDGEPENVGGTSLFMIFGGALSLLFIMGMMIGFELFFRPNHERVFSLDYGHYIYVPKGDVQSWD